MRAIDAHQTLFLKTQFDVRRMPLFACLAFAFITHGAPPQWDGIFTGAM